jgi:hypothetical protein
MSDIKLLDVDHIDWPNSVISAAIATPPGSPSAGDRYIVAASPTGAWSGHATRIARWSGSAWEFQNPTVGRLAHNEATSSFLKFTGSAWVDDDRTASGLRSATTIVDISAATAPTAGKVITAVDSTHATWQTPAAGLAVYWTPNDESVGGSANQGDYFIVTGGIGSGKVYQYLSSAWTFVGSVAGTAGSTWRSGTTAPVDATGINGDWYLRTTTGELFTRTAGVYVLVNTLQLALSYSTGLNLSGTTLTVVYGSSGTTACVGNDSRLSDDRAASGLRSATTLVSVSAATAPSAGQLLTAVDSTHATWQAPTGGSATALATTGADVNVNAAAPPAVGKVLTATDATHATWQTPAGGAPTGAAGGSLAGTYPNPDVAKIVETSGPTALTIGTITDGQYLKRVGSTLVSGSPASGTFALMTDINPRHWWDVTSTSQSGGLVDTLPDKGRLFVAGSGQKDFTQSGTPRCPTAVDGNGKTYMAPDGSADYYVAGAAADWKFLNDGSQWTIGMVMHRTVAISALEYILATYNGAGANTGLFFGLAYNSATNQGYWSFINAGGVGAPCGVDYQRPTTAIVTVVVRHVGNTNNVSSGAIPVNPIFDLFVGGALVSRCSYTGNAYNTGNPFGALTLFTSTSHSGNFSAARLYDLWIDDTFLSDRQIQGYGGYAHATWGALG